MSSPESGSRLGRLVRRTPVAVWLEWLLLVLVVVAFSRATLLDFDPRQLQQTGEHNESATLPILAEIGLWRYGEVPLWNPYMLTGFPTPAISSTTSGIRWPRCRCCCGVVSMA